MSEKTYRFDSLREQDDALVAMLDKIISETPCDGAILDTDDDIERLEGVTRMMGEADIAGCSDKRSRNPSQIYEGYRQAFQDPHEFAHPMRDLEGWSPAMHRSGLHEWHGKPGRGKTALAVALAAYWSNVSEGHVVLWFAGDHDGNVPVRFAACGGRDGALRAMPLPDPGEKVDIERWGHALTYYCGGLVRAGIEPLIVVDPLYALLLENVGGSVSTVLRRHLRISKYVPVLVIHHDRKGDGDDGEDMDAAEGSTQGAASARVMLRFKEPGQAVCSKDNASLGVSRKGARLAWDFNSDTGAIANLRWLSPDETLQLDKQAVLAEHNRREAAKAEAKRVAEVRKVHDVIGAAHRVPIGRVHGPLGRTLSDDELPALGLRRDGLDYVKVGDV